MPQPISPRRSACPRRHPSCHDTQPAPAHKAALNNLNTQPAPTIVPKTPRPARPATGQTGQRSYHQPREGLQPLHGRLRGQKRPSRPKALLSARLLPHGSAKTTRKATNARQRRATLDVTPSRRRGAINKGPHRTRRTGRAGDDARLPRAVVQGNYPLTQQHPGPFTQSKGQNKGRGPAGTRSPRGRKGSPEPHQALRTA